MEEGRDVVFEVERTRTVIVKLGEAERREVRMYPPRFPVAPRRRIFW